MNSQSLLILSTNTGPNNKQTISFIFTHVGLLGRGLIGPSRDPAFEAILLGWSSGSGSAGETDFLRYRGNCYYSLGEAIANVFGTKVHGA